MEEYFLESGSERICGQVGDPGSGSAHLVTMFVLEESP